MVVFPVGIPLFEATHGSGEAYHMGEECYRPCDGVGEVDGLHRVVLGNLEHGGDKEDTEAAGTQHGDHHRGSTE